MKRLLTLLLLTVCVPSAARSADAPAPVAAADLYRLSLALDPLVAPDGRHVVFTRSFFDIMSDRQRGELRLARLGAAGRIDARLLVDAGQEPGSARWSPDSRQIAFIGWTDSVARIHAIDIETGIARPVATLTKPGGELAWSPDGRWIAFTDHVEEPRVRIKGMPEPPPGANWAPEAHIVTRFHYRDDGNYAAGESRLLTGRRHLFVVSAAGGDARQLTQGETIEVQAASRLAWTHDSASVIFSSMPRPEPSSRNNDLYRVPVGGGAPVKLTSGAGRKSDPAVSPDGRLIAYAGTADKPGLHSRSDVWTMPMGGGAARNLTHELDRPAERPIWREDGRAVHILYSDAGRVRIALVAIDGGERRVLVEDVGGSDVVWPYTYGAAYSAVSGVVAYTTTHADRLPGLAIVGDGRLIGTLDLNSDWRRARRIGAVEEIRYRSAADGREIQGWLRFPPDFDRTRKYPLILEIHGGPIAAYGPRFAMEHELFAAAGYLVLFVNPRGSIGYGDEFADLYDAAPYFGGVYADLMSGVDALLQRPYVDQRNLFVSGASAGGTLTAWIVGNTDRFRAAAAWEPAIDWTMQVLISDTPDFFARYEVGALPWEDHERYWRRSPLSLVGKVKTPTLLVIGETDQVTPTAQTEAYYQALKMRGIDTMMVRLPEAGHWLGRPSQWLAGTLACIEWFDRYRLASP